MSDFIDVLTDLARAPTKIKKGRWKRLPVAAFECRIPLSWVPTVELQRKLLDDLTKLNFAPIGAHGIAVGDEFVWVHLYANNDQVTQNDMVRRIETATGRVKDRAITASYITQVDLPPKRNGGNRSSRKGVKKQRRAQKAAKNVTPAIIHKPQGA